VATEAPSLSLNGCWRFSLHGTHHRLDDTFADPDVDDSTWDVITVPSHWVLRAFHTAGEGAYGPPIYTNVQFPFPR